MAIVSLNTVDSDQRALERLLKERSQREQARLAQQQAEADAERFRLSTSFERQKRDDLRNEAGDVRNREQRELFAGARSQQDAQLRQSDRLAAERVRGGEIAAQHLVEERVRVEGQNAYRAQSTPPPPASSLADQLA
jgi:hypothetical protein